MNRWWPWSGLQVTVRRRAAPCPSPDVHSAPFDGRCPHLFRPAPDRSRAGAPGRPPRPPGR
ncbi:hypothetical protein [Ornithinimicrobium kibberense]|uniref:hypothetical protein n=1 Tax=Ornithinimicrobium kibberense TaxID=282060 RepID=UPI00361BB53A